MVTIFSGRILEILKYLKQVFQVNNSAIIILQDTPGSMALKLSEFTVLWKICFTLFGHACHKFLSISLSYKTSHWQSLEEKEIV